MNKGKNMSTTKKNKRTKKSSTKDTVTETVEAAAQVATEAAEAASVEEGTSGTSVALEDLKIGYVVGLTQEDRFVFELFGLNKGLVELLGIHQHASRKVNRVYDDQQMSGDRLLHEVGRAVAAIAQRLDGALGTTASTVTPEETMVEPPVATE
ncbi:hypothetical protein CMI41_01105 [Candidatus Pacearchaeota archaeon]|nr:hypothetical protein [Candidatus Pacearchaeota archaeon]